MPITSTNKQEVRRIVREEMRTMQDDSPIGVEEDETELNNFQDLDGLFDVLDDSSSIKNITPRRVHDQIKIEDDGSNGILWIYVNGLTSTNSDNWNKISLT